MYCVCQADKTMKVAFDSMNKIDVENLPDVDSWEWSSNMTEGEYLDTSEER